MTCIQLIKDATLTCGHGLTLLLKYYIFEHNQAGEWSIIIEKYEQDGDRIVAFEQASACCGPISQADITDFALKLANCAVTPVALDDAVSDMTTEYLNCVV